MHKKFKKPCTEPYGTLSGPSVLYVMQKRENKNGKRNPKMKIGFKKCNLLIIYLYKNFKSLATGTKVPES